MLATILFMLLSITLYEPCDSITVDCGATVMDAVYAIEISEVDPVGTLIVEFNNTQAPLRWSASANGSNTEYLSTFFSSSATDQGQDHTYGLQLKKVLDLELLELELHSLLQLTSSESDVLALQLSVSCRDYATEWKTWRFVVTILPVNEFYPEFLGAPFHLAVPENTQVGSEIFDIGQKAIDMDVGQTHLSFALAPYIITEFDGIHFVTMDDNKTGHITLRAQLDYESFWSHGRTYFFLNVTVSDEGGFTSATSVNVSVADSNDLGIEFVYPECSRPCTRVNYTLYTNETYTGLLHVLPVDILAQDLDTLSTPVAYSLTSDASDFFNMDSESGELYKTAALINDTFGYSLSLEVMVRELTDDAHYLLTNVTVYILERMPKTQQNAAA